MMEKVPELPTPATPNPLGALVAGVEQFLAELPDEAFSALMQRVRPPAETGV